MDVAGHEGGKEYRDPIELELSGNSAGIEQDMNQEGEKTHA